MSVINRKREGERKGKRNKGREGKEIGALTRAASIVSYKRG